MVWVSGAVIPLRVHPPILRQSDVRGYEHFVERVLALGASGYQDHEMARCLTAEGVRSARRVLLPVALVGEVRPAGGHILLTEQFKTQAKLEGQGTVFGLPQDLVVPRNWLYGTAVSGDGSTWHTAAALQTFRCLLPHIRHVDIAQEAADRYRRVPP